jgi:cytochrome bd ubiquinol oxidase subunit II
VWYASLFSGFYLALLLILVALIVRGVAFEYRGKVDSDRWRANWDRAIFFGSLVPALLWGVAFGNIVRGVHLDHAHEYSGTFFDLLNPYALLGGLTTLVLFTLHGAVFVALKTTDDLRERANKLAGQVGIAAVVIGASFLLWTQIAHGGVWSAVFAALAAVALIGAVLANRAGREGWAFLLSGVTIAAAVASLFIGLYPDVLPATNPANSLTIHNASSTHYTLVIMTWVAVIFTPIVLGYQAWTYWVFRRRISTKSIPPAPPEAAPVPEQRGASRAPVA